MNKLKSSNILRVFIHISIFVLGILFIKDCYNILNFSFTYDYNVLSLIDEKNPPPSLTKTSQFEQHFSKYTERVAAYVQLKERGFTSDAIISDRLSMSLVGDTYHVDDVDQEQLDFEFYNKKLNNINSNFIYYVKNISTETEYFSPYFTHNSKGNTITDEQVIKANIEDYVANLQSKDAYFILNTEKAVYITNQNNHGFFESNDIAWIANCIRGDYSLNTKEEILNSYPTNDAEFYKSQKNNYIIYVSVRNPITENNDEFYEDYTTYNKLLLNLQKAKKSFIPVLVLMVLCFVFATFMAGSSKSTKGVKLLTIDKFYSEIPLTIMTLSAFALTFFVFAYLNSYFHNQNIKNLLFCLIIYTITLPLTISSYLSVIRKIKTKQLITSSLLYKFVSKLKDLFNQFFSSSKVIIKLNIILCLFIIGNLALTYLFIGRGTHYWILYVLSLVLFYGFVATHLAKLANKLENITKVAKEISDGNQGSKIIENDLEEPLSTLAVYINNISDGISVAVNEKLKSERFKTELITNVSHDIKTPLTSIINYVDLLNKEDLQNENAKNYLEILNAKSWRLKNLIEDLVEASKASSGAIKMQPQPLNMVELLCQAIGEFEDRFSQKGLEPILNGALEPVIIYADGRSTFRIIDNVFSNAFKYALEGTRIYIDIRTTDKDAEISVKNISSSKLNINATELMERFVRGDISRNTEGSGLGLSISKSLATLQNGKFDLEVDGDLFKVILTLPLWKK